MSTEPDNPPSGETEPDVRTPTAEPAGTDTYTRTVWEMTDRQLLAALRQQRSPRRRSILEAEARRRGVWG
jgi:hypothetical protein